MIQRLQIPSIARWLCKPLSKACRLCGRRHQGGSASRLDSGRCANARCRVNEQSITRQRLTAKATRAPSAPPVATLTESCLAASNSTSSRRQGRSLAPGESGRGLCSGSHDQARYEKRLKRSRKATMHDAGASSRAAAQRGRGAAWRGARCKAAAKLLQSPPPHNCFCMAPPPRLPGVALRRADPARRAPRPGGAAGGAVAQDHRAAAHPHRYALPRLACRAIALQGPDADRMGC